MRDRSADHRGQGPFNQNCQFPFTYNGVTYDSCTDQDNAGVPWCSVFNDLFGNYQGCIVYFPRYILKNIYPVYPTSHGKGAKS